MLECNLGLPNLSTVLRNNLIPTLSVSLKHNELELNVNASSISKGG